MINDGKPITPDMLKSARLGGPHTASIHMTEMIANIALMAVQELVDADRPWTGGIGMTAFGVAAGVIQGTMEADGLVPELDEATITKLMVENFKTGRELGTKAGNRRNEAKRAAEVAEAACKSAAKGTPSND